MQNGGTQRPNLIGDPANAFGSSNFGTITGTKVEPRNVQLGFKYYF